jgi:hypothetical protein
MAAKKPVQKRKVPRPTLPLVAAAKKLKPSAKKPAVKKAISKQPVKAAKKVPTKH